MIFPTIGRKLWYHPSFLDRKLGDQPFDATVVYVHSPRSVNLVVFGHRGESMVKEHVKLLQEGEAKPFGGESYAEWMPYQKGQAAKEPDKSPSEEWRRGLEGRLLSLEKRIDGPLFVDPAKS